jgi:hypothetical protein
MGRGRAAGALIAVLISDALIDIVRGGDLVECEPQRVTGDGRHWAYRIVDGRECWYAGRPGKPKNELFWDRAPSDGPARGRDEGRTTRCPFRPRGRATRKTGDHRGNVGAMARERSRPAACVHLLLAGVGGGRPGSTADTRATGLAASPATTRPLRAVVDCRAKRVFRAVRAEHAGRVVARRHTRLPSSNGRDGVRESQEVSAVVVVRERPNASRDNEQLSSCRQSSTALDHSATSLFVLPINEEQQVSLASLVDAPDPVLNHSRLVTG